VTRMSVDQKQVLLQRSAEDERHRLQSALTRECEASSSDVDNNDSVTQPSSELSVDNTPSVDKDVKSVSSDKNIQPSEITDPGT